MTFEPRSYEASLDIKPQSFQELNRLLYHPTCILTFFSFPPSSDTNNPEFLISFIAIQRQMGVGTDWSQNMQTEKQTELRYSYRFICSESYYGESCSKKCSPRDDRFGHYTCNRDGQLSCLPGWKGKYCEERKQSTTCELLYICSLGLLYFMLVDTRVLLFSVARSPFLCILLNTRRSSRCLQMT